MTSRPSTAAPILAVLAIGLVTLGAYVGGYFWLGRRIDEPFIGYPPSSRRERDDPVRIFRSYPSPWMTAMFQPAGKVESWFRGIPVSVSDDIAYGNDEVLNLP